MSVVFDNLQLLAEGRRAAEFDRHRERAESRGLADR
jgi:hypothetical protein